MGRMLWTTAVVASLVGIILAVGFQLFRPRSPALPAKGKFEALLETPAEDFPPTSETGKGALALRESPTSPAVEPKHDQKLADSSSDEAIRNAFFPHQTEDRNDARQVENQVNSGDRDRVQTQLDNIEKEFAKLPGGPESAPARTVLLQTVSTLDLDAEGSDAVHELAMTELLQGVNIEELNSAQSTSFNYFLPVLAHEVALKTSIDSSEALAITLDGMQVQHDPGVRYSLVRNFISRYPDLEPQLREELYRRDIRPSESDLSADAGSQLR
jgi:hypothetical protein